MSSFHNGFHAELVKLAKITARQLKGLSKLKLSPEAKAWALSRGATAGLAAALMGLALSSTSGSRNKEKKRSGLGTAAAMGLTGTATGLGKGLVEHGLEKKLLKVFKK